MGTSAYVYILQCSDGSLYTGMTTDTERRIKEHRSGKGSKYVRAKLPVEYVLIQECENKSAAMRKEAKIKKLTRKQKLELIGKWIKGESIEMS